jgi:hypothetical protein
MPPPNPPTRRAIIRAGPGARSAAGSQAGCKGPSLALWFPLVSGSRRSRPSVLWRAPIVAPSVAIPHRLHHIFIAASCSPTPGEELLLGQHLVPVEHSIRASLDVASAYRVDISAPPLARPQRYRAYCPHQPLGARIPGGGRRSRKPLACLCGLLPKRRRPQHGVENAKEAMAKAQNRATIARPPSNRTQGITTVTRARLMNGTAGRR